MNKMNAPELEVVHFQSEDVIATSQSALKITGPIGPTNYVTSQSVFGSYAYQVKPGSSGVSGDLLSVVIKNSEGAEVPYLSEGQLYDVSTTYGGGVVITACPGGHDHRLVYSENGVDDIDKFLLGVAYVGDGK